MCVEIVLVAQWCPALCNPADCSPPGSSVHGISQARVLEWGAIAFSEQDGRRGKIMLTIKPHRDAWRTQTKPWVHQDPEAPQRLSQTCLWVFECLLWRHASAVACRGDRGSGCSRPGTRQHVAQTLLEEAAISSTIDLPS